MEIDRNKAVLGEWVSAGFTIEENFQEETVSVIFKGKVVATYDQEIATKRMLQNACRDQWDAMTSPVPGVVGVAE
jgi:hypothetical protein